MWDAWAVLGSTVPAAGTTARVDRLDELEGALHGLGLGAARPTLVLAGGAGKIDRSDSARLGPLFDELAAAAGRLGAAVVDGGTDAGVMRLLGAARAAHGSAFPLVGVVAEALVGTEAELEPRHSHFILVPGERWGDETPWLGRVAALLAGQRPSLTLLVNGGEISLDEVAASIAAGRPVLVVDGSGRAADALAAALRGEPAEERVRTLAAAGIVRAADQGSAAREVEAVLAGGGGRGGS